MRITLTLGSSSACQDADGADADFSSTHAQ